MDQDRSTACLHVPKFDQPPSRWYLKQQPRTKQHEQHHCYYHWPPVRHITLCTLKTEAFRERTREIQRQRNTKPELQKGSAQILGVLRYCVRSEKERWGRLSTWEINKWQVRWSELASRNKAYCFRAFNGLDSLVLIKDGTVCASSGVVCFCACFWLIFTDLVKLLSGFYLVCPCKRWSWDYIQYANW